MVEAFSPEFYAYAYEVYLSVFDKKYDESEKPKRLKIFIENYKIILAHNLNIKSSFKMKVNQFTDMTQNEFDR